MIATSEWQQLDFDGLYHWMKHIPCGKEHGYVKGVDPVCSQCEPEHFKQSQQVVPRSSLNELYGWDKDDGWNMDGEPLKHLQEWQMFFHSKDEALNAPPIRFLIDGFLQADGVTAIAAPVRERKSLIALNIAHALLTGEKLFGRFEVTRKPDRVLYLCPEVSLGPFTDRIKKIGLMDYVDETFFYRTMSSEVPLDLADDVFCDALPGAVVFLDTAIRFLKGDENSANDVRAFADSIFALLRHGATAVILLHHSPKDMGDSMTLESAMRGSGDMGAFLQSCWGTRLQDPEHPYESASYLMNLKQRDFESEPFEVTCGEDCRMRIVDSSLDVPVSLAPRRAFKGNRDGRDDHAISFLQANPKMSLRDASRALKEMGIARSKTWISNKRYEWMQMSTNGGA